MVWSYTDSIDSDAKEEDLRIYSMMCWWRWPDLFSYPGVSAYREVKIVVVKVNVNDNSSRLVLCSLLV